MGRKRVFNGRSCRTAVIGGAAAAITAAFVGGPALATTPTPPPGSLAVTSAPSSLVGLTPQLPADVIAASSAPGSRWKPEPAKYGTASTDDIAVPGAGGTTIRVNEI